MNSQSEAFAILRAFSVPPKTEMSGARSSVLKRGRTFDDPELLAELENEEAVFAIARMHTIDQEVLQRERRKTDEYCQAPLVLYDGFECVIH